MTGLKLNQQSKKFSKVISGCGYWGWGLILYDKEIITASLHNYDDGTNSILIEGTKNLVEGSVIHVIWELILCFFLLLGIRGLYNFVSDC